MRRSHSLRFLLLVLVLLSTAGCWRVVVKSGARPGGEVEPETGWHFFWGLTSTSHAAPECRDGLARVEVKQPFWSLACVAPLTAGIVSATKTRYVCAAPDPALMAPPPVLAPAE